jgi:high-affinity iron transporter
MFGASIIVFRESLEAALLIGIISAATRGLPQRNRWLAIGIGAGLAGSIVVALLTESIAQLADGSGQELFNAAVLGIAVLMLGWHNIWMASHGAEMAKNAKRVGQAIQNGTQELSTIAIVVALAVLREGSETALFLHGIAATTEGGAATVILGGALGLLLGAVAGVAIYAGLLRIPVRWFFSVTSTLLLLLAAGLAGQMARFLIQGDWLPAMASPLWDSSSVLPITSFLGAALHVLIGYDAQPSGMQVLFYVATLITIMLGTSWVRHQNSSHHKLKSI